MVGKIPPCPHKFPAPLTKPIRIWGISILIITKLCICRMELWKSRVIVTRIWDVSTAHGCVFTRFRPEKHEKPTSLFVCFNEPLTKEGSEHPFWDLVSCSSNSWKLEEILCHCDENLGCQQCTYVGTFLQDFVQ